MGDGPIARQQNTDKTRTYIHVLEIYSNSRFHCSSDSKSYEPYVALLLADEGTTCF